MNLFCVGLSHHNADVEMRERFTGNAETDCVLRHSGCVEALVLTTCNRVEVYGVSETRVSTLDIARCLARTIDKHIPPDSAPFYRYEDAQCAQHLFRVASGLDSMILGEAQIHGQVRDAWESCRGYSGIALNRLYQTGLMVGSRVREQTGIGRGAASVSS